MSFANTNTTNAQPTLVDADDHEGLRRTLTITSTRTLTAADSGSLIYIGDNSGAGATVNINLPAAKAGLWFEVLVTSSSITEDVRIVAADSDTMYGQIWITDGAVAANIGIGISAADQILLDLTGGETAGDRCTLMCDGTNWYAQCFSTSSAVWVASG